MFLAWNWKEKLQASEWQQKKISYAATYQFIGLWNPESIACFRPGVDHLWCQVFTFKTLQER